MKTCHQPEVLASSSGLKEVTRVPKMGTSQRKQRTARKILVGQPAMAGLASPRPPPPMVFSASAFGVSSMTVVEGKVMRSPPLP